jgi:hypothetical protein
MPAYKYWRKIGLEHEIADISLQLEGQGESLKQNNKLKGQSLKYIAGDIYFQKKKNAQLTICSSKVNPQYFSTKTVYGIF